MASRRNILAGFAALSALAAGATIPTKASIIAPRTPEEWDLIHAFRGLDPEMQEAFITMLRAVKAGVPMRDASIVFWMAGGWTREDAEIIVDDMLAGRALTAGTGSA